MGKSAYVFSEFGKSIAIAFATNIYGQILLVKTGLRNTVIFKKRNLEKCLKLKN